MKDDISVLKLQIIDEQERQLVFAYLADCDDIVAIEEADTHLIIYHQDLDVLQNALVVLMENLPFSIAGIYQFSTMPSRNWNQEWESSFEPIQVEDFCIVRASFHSPSNDERIEIVIDPEMAFGTGHHETTYLMLRQMREIEFKHKTVLDYGSGTAILAILAEKMGSKNVIAIDYDPQATECASQCLLLNSCSHITLQTGEIIDVSTNHFDIILANINRNVLLSAATEVANRQQSGGLLLLSGIMDTDQEIITLSYSNAGYMLQQVSQKAEWLCMTWIRV